MIVVAGKYTSIGLSACADVLVFLVVLAGAFFLLRLLNRRQMGGKYTLLWMFVGVLVLALAAYPSALDRVSHFLNIYYAPTTLFLAAIGFLFLVCVYFSYELSRLEERTRILAEELAILRRRAGDAGRRPHRRPARAVGPADAVAITRATRCVRRAVPRRRGRAGGRRGRTCGAG